MFGEEKKLKNLTDTNSPLPNLPLIKGEELGGGLTYRKTDKLITALYMVTDIIDKDEPIRNKLRTLGTGIISDTYLIKQNNTGHTLSFMGNKISEIMSFLDLASAMNIISEMNCNILRKEFSILNQSIIESSNKTGSFNKQINLAEFFTDSSSPDKGRNEEGLRPPLSFGHLPLSRGREISKGRTGVGVQKGSTLLKALKKIQVSDRNVNHGDVFDLLKKQRQDSIINIVKNISGGATIKDIKDKVQANPKQNDSLVFCSEKTLQRELVSMVKNGVLNKTGEKRWSRYFIKL
jgi:hypothetical protein